jgi:putative tryptophan/tyrosine transport system substrate-binding protein
VKRRDLIKVIAASAAVWPLRARAQQTAMPLIGYLNSESRETYREYFSAFHRGLNETGFIEDRNVIIEYRWAEGHNDRLPAMAADLTRRGVAVIATNNTPSALAAKAATQTIPTVFLTGSDPVLIGLVASLNRPTGTLTGVAVLNTGMVAKRLQLLHEFVPTATSIGLLVNSTNPVFAEAEIREIQAGAHVLGLRLLVLNASSQREIEAAFTTLIQQRVGALVVSADSYFLAQPDRLLTLADRYAVPTIYAYREFTAAGGLMSYGPNLLEAYRLVGVYTGRILKGDKPADLPVQQVTRIELVINLKTAKALGLTFPLPQLGRADEVIE